MGLCRLFCGCDRLPAICLCAVSATFAVEGKKAVVQIVRGYCCGSSSIFAGMFGLSEPSILFQNVKLFDINANFEAGLNIGIL